MSNTSKRLKDEIEESHRRLEESVANLNDAVARLAEEQRRVWRARNAILKTVYLS